MMRRASARLDIVGRYNTERVGGGAFPKGKKGRGKALPSHVLLYSKWAESEFYINSDNALSPPAAYF